jgi:hypothetical protein
MEGHTRQYQELTEGYERQHRELMNRYAQQNRETMDGYARQHQELTNQSARQHQELMEGCARQNRELVERCDRQSEIIERLNSRIGSLEAALSVLACAAGLGSLHRVMLAFQWTNFPRKPGPPPDGIVAHLARKCGANPARSGIVDVDLSGVYDLSRSGPNAFDFMTATDACAGTICTEAQWISFDFKTLSLIPTAYWIRSYSGRVNSAHLRSWVLEGCQDPAESNWVELDKRTDTTVLNNAQPRKCRALRLRSTGPTHWAGNWGVIISGFEVFGYLLENEGHPAAPG